MQKYWERRFLGGEAGWCWVYKPWYKRLWIFVLAMLEEGEGV